MPEAQAPDSAVSPRPWGLLFAGAISLSIGWGIRGNFGHEYGAMVPGALAALAACLLSGREDWRRRAVYFAFFGALGWGFGGSMSYMQVISYTHSGHLPSQVYGFACLFVLGFLWAALGGAGTALPAVLDGPRLRQMIRPIAWVLAFWLLQDWLEAAATSDRRHESLLYWLDSDWTAALVAVIALLSFDLWERRFAKIPSLLLFAGAGALAGWLIQGAIDIAGLTETLASWLVRREGDAAMWAKDELLINWPQFLPLIGAHVGWIVGLAAGLGIHFWRHGAFRSGAALLLHMAIGWWCAFLLLPVLLGIRMTPPRGDSWAGILGVFGGAAVYFLRSGLRSVLHASIVSGIAGGIGFPGAAWLKLLLAAPGNPARTADPAAIQAWAHWQAANWHSFLEQTYGLINGIGIAVALGTLARRQPALGDDAPSPGGWTKVFAAAFVLIGVTYLNLVKNVQQWVQAKAMSGSMKAPLFGSLELSASAWFHLAYAILGGGLIVLMAVHVRRRLPVLPATALGRGQLFYALFLWWMVAGNFERALVSFRESRLITEGVVFVNAVIVLMIVFLVPRESDLVPARPPAPPRLVRLATFGAIALVFSVLVETATVRWIYGDRFCGHSGKHTRFGTDASWRTQPLLKGKDHR